jgi:hypothetical protein
MDYYNYYYQFVLFCNYDSIYILCFCIYLRHKLYKCVLIFMKLFNESLLFSYVANKFNKTIGDKISINNPENKIITKVSVVTLYQILAITSNIFCDLSSSPHTAQSVIINNSYLRGYYLIRITTILLIYRNRPSPRNHNKSSVITALLECCLATPPHY